MLFSGTVVTAGRARGVVVGTGAATAIGKIRCAGVWSVAPAAAAALRTNAAQIANTVANAQGHGAAMHALQLSACAAFGVCWPPSLYTMFLRQRCDGGGSRTGHTTAATLRCPLLTRVMAPLNVMPYCRDAMAEAQEEDTPLQQTPTLTLLTPV